MSIYVDERLKNICLSVRAEKDVISPSGEPYHCREVSIAICILAAKENYTILLCDGKCRDSSGVYRDHYWVRFENTIYDATADQFFDSGKLNITTELDGNYDERFFVCFNQVAASLVFKN